MFNKFRLSVLEVGNGTLVLQFLCMKNSIDNFKKRKLCALKKKKKDFAMNAIIKKS